MFAQCSEGPIFRRFYVQKIFVQKVLCSDGIIFRRSYVQKVLCQKYLFRRSYTQKVLYVQKILYSEIFVWKVLYPEGPMFRRSYIQKILFVRSYAGTHFHLSASGIKTSRVFFPTQLYYSLLLGIHANRFQSYEVLGTSNSEIPQVPGTWKPRAQVPKFCRHVWRFALCLFCN